MATKFEQTKKLLSEAGVEASEELAKKIFTLLGLETEEKKHRYTAFCIVPGTDAEDGSAVMPIHKD